MLYISKHADRLTLKQSLTSKNAPICARGYGPVPGTVVDRKSAVLGVVDESKFYISFDTQKEDPPKSGNFVGVRGKRAEYSYLKDHERPDFYNIKDVRDLNDWRRQIIQRKFRGIREESREPWLVSEKNLTLGQAAEQLRHRRFPWLKWNRLANSYNHSQQGIIQGTTETYLSPGNRKILTLAEERNAPWRTAAAIKKHATEWPETQQL